MGKEEASVFLLILTWLVRRNLAKQLEGSFEQHSKMRFRIQSNDGFIVVNWNQLARFADAGTVQNLDLAKKYRKRVFENPIENLLIDLRRDRLQIHTTDHNGLGTRLDANHAYSPGHCLDDASLVPVGNNWMSGNRALYAFGVPVIRQCQTGK